MDRDGALQPEAARSRPENFRFLAPRLGARGVYVGSDLSAEEWTAQVRAGLAEFSEHPRVLQRFIKGSLTRQDYVAENDEIVTLTGRAAFAPTILSWPTGSCSEASWPHWPPRTRN